MDATQYMCNNSPTAYTMINTLYKKKHKDVLDLPPSPATHLFVESIGISISLTRPVFYLVLIGLEEEAPSGKSSVVFRSSHSSDLWSV